MPELTIVRNNLMTREEYQPYCGNFEGGCSLPRANWDGGQFKCPQCGWRSAFPSDFIERYRARWGK